MALPDPVTRKEMYLNKAATGSGSVPPEPVTREEMYLAEIANGGGGASSLADLSDVDIDTSQVGNLLRYNDDAGKWENVRPDVALMGSPCLDFGGVLTVNDAGVIAYERAAIIPLSSEVGAGFSQIIQAAIAYGQFLQSDMDYDSLRPMVERASSCVIGNVPLYLAITGNGGLYCSFPLSGASEDEAIFSGIILHGTKYYRITIVINCAFKAQAGSVLAIAEEIATITAP